MSKSEVLGICQTAVGVPQNPSHRSHWFAYLCASILAMKCCQEITCDFSQSDNLPLSGNGGGVEAPISFHKVFTASLLLGSESTITSMIGASANITAVGFSSDMRRR